MTPEQIEGIKLHTEEINRTAEQHDADRVSEHAQAIQHICENTFDFYEKFCLYSGGGIQAYWQPKFGLGM